MRTALVLGGVSTVAFILACGGGTPLVPGGPSLGDGTPLYGATTVSAGFPEVVVDVRAGGSTATTDMGLPESCVGYITPDQPDYRVTASAPGPQLRFASCADADTALAIRGPDGTWHCNDDAEGRNPIVDLKGPRPGDYDVWVATYGAATSVAATLHITEAEGGICARIHPEAEPKVGTTTLSPGFGQAQVVLTAGGPIQASDVQGMSGCSGMIDGSAPQVRLEVTAPAPLSLGSCAAADTTLAIRDPSGTWHCDDDTEDANPVVRFPRASAGTYAVFAGTFGESTTIPASLIIKEQATGPVCSSGK